MIALLLLLSMVYVCGLYRLNQCAKHFTFYMWGALGMLLVSLLFIITFHWDIPLASLEANHTLEFAHQMGIRMKIIGQTIMLVATPEGWVGLRIGLECSTFVEATAFVALTAFYPAIQLRKRVQIAGLGILTLYIFNLIRLLIIVTLISQNGEGAYLLAHGILGRIFFFVGAVGLYTGTFTRLTLRHVHRNVTSLPAATNNVG